MMMIGSFLMRSSLAPRTRSSRPNPSSFGMSMSDTTITMVGSLSMACQPSSPLGTSRTAKEVLRIRLKVVRTNFESSTIRTLFSGMSCAIGASAGQVDDDPPSYARGNEALEDGRQLFERNGFDHLLQARRLQIGPEASPYFGAQLRRRRV